MIKSGLALAAAAFTISPYGPLPLTDTHEPNGRWTAEVHSSSCDGEARGEWCLQFNLTQGARMRRSNWGFSAPARDLSGVTIDSRDFTARKIRFELKRPAGILTFDGDFEDGEGDGDYAFAGNAEYASRAEKAGFSRPDDRDLMALAIHDISSESITDLGRRGYSGDIDDVIAFAIHGVDADFIDELKGLGYEHPSADQLVALRIHGVTGQFIEQMRSDRGQKASLDDLVAMRIHGVDGRLARTLADLDIGYDNDDLVALKVHGVDLDLARSLRDLKVDVDVDGLVSLAVQGVNADYIERMTKLGLGQFDVDDLVSLKVQGVSPEYVRGMMDAGLGRLDIDDLVGAKVQGVDPRWISEMVKAGLKGVDLDDLIGLKVQGVDPDFVRSELNRYPDSDADEITSAWMHRGSKKRHRD